MRILGGILIVLGLLFCLSILGAFIGIPMMVLGIVLVALGARRTVITNVVSVQTAPATATDLPYITEEKIPGANELRREPLLRPPGLGTIQAPAAAYDQGKWQMLVKYDDDIRSAAERVRPFGDQYEAELATAFLQVNDKSYLEPIVKKIIQQAGAGIG